MDETEQSQAIHMSLVAFVMGAVAHLTFGHYTYFTVLSTLVFVANTLLR